MLVLILIYPALLSVSHSQQTITALGWKDTAPSVIRRMSDLQTTTRPTCVLGTPACPQCKDTGLESNGGFLTCATCGLAITRQALLREALGLQLSVEPQ